MLLWREMTPELLGAIIASGTIVLFLVLTALLRHYQAIKHPAREPLRLTRNVVLPGFAVVLLLNFVLHVQMHETVYRITQTVFWVLVIWVVPSLFKALFFTRVDSNLWRARVPELFLDIIRFALVVVGIALVFAGVWGRDLGGFFATLGIGSIVIGLALQDTLGNLMAGIALLFERPFAEGDWVRVGDTVGTVHETNWRAVRIVTRSRDEVIVPNSVLGKERIQNYSRPTRLHAVEVPIGFSYSDPPNKVKQVLTRVALATRGVQQDGVIIRTLAFQDSAIEYQVRFFITDFERLPDIQEEFLTRAWYAMRRNRLTIPYPTRTVYKTDVPLVPAAEDVEEIRGVLRTIELFTPLSDDEIENLARDAVLHEFAKGERVVHQGDDGDTLCIIRHGRARVTLGEIPGAEKEVAVLEAGHCFGEMALLTGEPRAANVDAIEDLELIMIYKTAVEPILRARPILAEAFAVLVSERQGMLRNMEEETAAERLAAEQGNSQGGEVLRRIRRFFAIPS